jgi:hypothetical protein
MSISKFFLFFIFILFLGCSQKNSTKDIETNSNTPQFYMVIFSDNIFGIHLTNIGKKSLQKAIKLTLIQSAKIALENGYNYFILIDKQKHTDKKYANNGYSNIIFNNITYHITKPNITNTIVCFKEKPELIGEIYSAKAILDKKS